MKYHCIAYYCSGHGYGHATRVSALASQLLSLQPHPTLYIVSSAPQHVFSDSIALGALYRFAEIDPVIVQPLAYRVDRQKSVDVLRTFLSQKEEKLQTEQQWLAEIGADCVLSDAAFLACLAAKRSHIPSALITNFTFDSVFSYLSTSILDSSSPQPTSNLHLPNPTTLADALVPDIPILEDEIEPLVHELHAGYSCADLLVLLPGAIPIPSFPGFAELPSTRWVDPSSRRFQQRIVHSLCFSHLDVTALLRQRRTILAPLLVRPPSTAEHVSPYTPAGRARLLSSIGVPSHLHNPDRTKVLVVSFGGQVVRRPSSRSGTGSRNSRASSPNPRTANGDQAPQIHKEENDEVVNDLGIKVPRPLRARPPNIYVPTTNSALLGSGVDDVAPPRRLATPSHIWIPGAPPASKPHPTPPATCDSFVPSLRAVPPTPKMNGFDQDDLVNESSDLFGEAEEEPKLLPDETWIAIVCGVSKEQWLDEQQEEGLPEGFFVAPKDIYMPDLTAVSDVLLGKLGYGTVAECVDACTPFVYVSRPLFIEEHGLRLFLEDEGVGVELARGAYERGEWAGAVAEAWERGKRGKMEKRKRSDGAGTVKAGTAELAKTIVNWVEDWWKG